MRWTGAMAGAAMWTQEIGNRAEKEQVQRAIARELRVVERLESSEPPGGTQLVEFDGERMVAQILGRARRPRRSTGQVTRQHGSQLLVDDDLWRHLSATALAHARQHYSRHRGLELMGQALQRLGRNIRTARLRRRWRLEDVAERMGVSRFTVAAAQYPIEQLADWARAL